MRWLIAVVAVAGCGADEGAVLTVVAPDGPATAARLEIVLANVDPMTISTIGDQRVSPLDATLQESARYYRQRATAGEIEGIGSVDGFTLRIEPNVAMVADRTFIPFVIAYDEHDDVVGVGTVNGVDGEPTTISIESGMARQYVVDMIALVPSDGATALAERQAMRVTCGDDVRWPSGIAWRRPGAMQLRLLLPDRDDDATATDASERPADLDCDAHVAPDQDCDDLRPLFHTGRTDVCDGVDSNCDGQRVLATDCVNETCGASGGVQFCDDRTGQPITTCAPSPACACDNGMVGCSRCVFSYERTNDPDRQTPCAPGVGKLKVPACSANAPCTIAVLPPVGSWRAFIAATPTSGFTTMLANVTTGEIYVEAKLSALDVMAVAGESIGAIYLQVTQGTQTREVGVDLQLAQDSAVTRCVANPGTNTFDMFCSP